MKMLTKVLTLLFWYNFGEFNYFQNYLKLLKINTGQFSYLQRNIEYLIDEDISISKSILQYCWKPMQGIRIWRKIWGFGRYWNDQHESLRKASNLSCTTWEFSTRKSRVLPKNLKNQPASKASAAFLKSLEKIGPILPRFSKLLSCHYLFRNS